MLVQASKTRSNHERCLLEAMQNAWTHVPCVRKCGLCCFVQQWVERTLEAGQQRHVDSHQTAVTPLRRAHQKRKIWQRQQFSVVDRIGAGVMFVGCCVFAGGGHEERPLHEERQLNPPPQWRNQRRVYINGRRHGQSATSTTGIKSERKTSRYHQYKVHTTKR